MSLIELFRNAKRVIVTAHSGYIGRYPENSIVGLGKAVEAGTDIVEFDLRGTSDHVIVLQHDSSLERTSNGRGLLEDHTFNEIKNLNFSYYSYNMDCTGTKLENPRHSDFPITKFDTVLEELSLKTFMNIQVYTKDQTDLRNICGLFREYNMYERAYLTMINYTEAEKIRAIDSDIELCVLDRPTTINTLLKLKNFGCRYIQPRRPDITNEFCGKCRELDLFANLYYSNTDEDNRYFINLGIQGILTDYPDILLNTIENM